MNGSSCKFFKGIDKGQTTRNIQKFSMDSGQLLYYTKYDSSNVGENRILAQTAIDQ